MFSFAVWWCGEPRREGRAMASLWERHHDRADVLGVKRLKAAMACLRSRTHTASARSMRLRERLGGVALSSVGSVLGIQFGEREALAEHEPTRGKTTLFVR